MYVYRYLILFLFYLATSMALSSASAEPNCQFLSGFQDIKSCNITIKSTFLNDKTFIKAWIPDHIKNNTPVILFLHGRGYAVLPDSQNKFMVEAAGLEDWFKTKNYRTNPAIVLSPQDLFTRKDSTQIGNDYWIGAEGRNWENFIINELKPYINNYFSLDSHLPWAAAGISMGAHGAMKVTLDHPSEFNKFISLSPVFRSTANEIHGPDEEVFFQFNADLEKTSIGARLLHDQSLWKQLAKTPHWIETHEYDFALGNEFPDSKHIWERFVSDKIPNGNNIPFINKEHLQNPGHTMEFWHSRLPLALAWLNQKK